MRRDFDSATTLSAMLSGGWKNRALIRQMVRRDIASRYRGSLLGILWAFATPLIMLGIYTLVFGVVFKARWGTESPLMHDGIGAFSLIIFSGLILHQFLAEVLTRSTSIIVAHTNYVKKVIFPLEILPVTVVFTALFHACIHYFILLALLLLAGHAPSLPLLWLPVIWLPLVMLALGLSWMLASLGTYLRDLGQIIGLATMALLFLSPIFYPRDSLPEAFRDWLLLNPLTFPIEATRNALLWHLPPDPKLLSIYGLISLFVLAAGFWWFQKTRKGFSDVL